MRGKAGPKTEVVPKIQYRRHNKIRAIFMSAARVLDDYYADLVYFSSKSLSYGRYKASSPIRPSMDVPWRLSWKEVAGKEEREPPPE